MPAVCCTAPAQRNIAVCSASSPRGKVACNLPSIRLGTALASMSLAATLATGASTQVPSIPCPLCYFNAGSAYASDGPTKVTEFAASGLIFKDSVEVVAFADPDGATHLCDELHLGHLPHAVTNVTIYISDFKRSLADKLSKDFFSEPSQASVTCVANGPVTIKNPGNVKASGGQEIFSEGKGINLFQQKTLRVRRVYHDNTLLYVSYSTRLSSTSDDGVSSGRYRTSICALPVAPVPVAELVAQ